jgi:hypothetical protein
MTAKPDGWPERRDRWKQFSNITLAELQEWTWAQNLPAEEVRLTQVHIKYVTDENVDERIRREANEVEQRERQEKWERETLARLKAKYEEAGS